MIPTLPTIIEENVDVSTTKNPLIDFGEKRIVGWTDGKSALHQWIYGTLNVERYENILHSWQYGIETNNLYGKHTDYVRAELQSQIEEALSVDDRILSVEEFEFSTNGRAFHITFVCNSIYGDDKIEFEVTV